MVEIHITTQPLNPAELEKFLAFCKGNDFKPILIELDQGETMQQPMISKTIEVKNEHECYNELYEIRRTFENARFPVVREKVEIPLDFYDKGKWYYRGDQKYFEYHAKLQYNEISDLQKLAQLPWVHISRNALKDEPNRRFVTYRGYGTKDEFLEKISDFGQEFEKYNLLIVKKELEYCILDRGKKIDEGWIDEPLPKSRPENLDIIALEGFLRRASLLDEGFVLKGSLLTRQYLADRKVRPAEDIDFIYRHKLSKGFNPAGMFSAWAKRITEIKLDDDLEFRNFSENDFWRAIDYAMHEDFPTTSTDIDCVYKGKFYHRFHLDISWNLPLEDELVSLQYVPESGFSFLINQTIPISLQISWKLHQTVVRPRIKDLIDVIMMLSHVTLTQEQKQRTLYHFTEECQKDNIPADRLKYFTNKEVSRFYGEHQKEMVTAFQTKFEFLTPFGFSFQKHFDIEVSGQYEPRYNYGSTVDLLNRFEDALIKEGLVVE